MGRAGEGLEVRESSIRLSFTLDGVRQKHTVMVNGEPIRPTPANLKYAARLSAEIKDRIRYGTFSLKEYFPASGTGTGQTLLSQQLDAWLETERIAKSTREGYESVIKFWKAELGDKPIRALKPSEIKKALASYPTLSGKTINNRVSVLRKALDLAVLDQTLSTNPVAGLQSATWQRRPVDPFTQQEVEAILAHMREHCPAQVYNYTAFKFYTGLRTGESFGLQWPTVDIASQRMVVSESVVGGEEKDSTKTNTTRLVYLNSIAFEAIKDQKQYTYLAGAHVFHDPRDNSRWKGEPKFRFYWLATLKRLGIRHRRPYNTRHTYATLMLMKGVRPAFAATQMGHSVDMFLKTYAKWIPGAGDLEEMAKLEVSPLNRPQKSENL